MNIKIRARLSAYTKGTLPTKVSDLTNDLNFISEVPVGTTAAYARKYGEWVNIDDALTRDTFTAGNDINIVQSGHNYTISSDEWVGTQDEFDALTSYTKHTYIITDAYSATTT